MKGLLILLLSLTLCLLNNQAKAAFRIQSGQAHVSLDSANIVCHGNSLTFGTPGAPTVSYPAQLAADTFIINRGIRVTNRGTGGITTTGLSAEAPAEVDPLLVEGKINIDVFLEGLTR